MIWQLFIISAWRPVVRETIIPFDLESTPLQIKSNSIVGSYESIYVDLYTKDNEKIGHWQLQFKSPMRIFFGHCSSWISLHPGDKVDKTWTFRKTATALIIECNGVEVMNFKFPETSRWADCVPRWGGDVVKKIMFHAWDAASDSYQEKPIGNEGENSLNPKYLLFPLLSI